MIEIVYSPTFKRNYRRLPKDIKLIAERKEIVFRKNPFEYSLKAHKLHGILKDYWSFSLSREYRIIFEFITKKVVHFHLVGKHDIYK